MNDLEVRLFNFSVESLSLLRKIKYSDVNRVIINQLAKSSTSAGANYSIVNNIFVFYVKIIPLLFP